MPPKLGIIQWVHYYHLRPLINDFNRFTSRVSLNVVCNRATPEEYNDYKVERLLISIVMNTTPFVLFHEVLSHSVLERRRPCNPRFLDMSRSRVIKQSFSYRINAIARPIKFEWLDRVLSKETIRSSLKHSFFIVTFKIKFTNDSY